MMKRLIDLLKFGVLLGSLLFLMSCDQGQMAEEEPARPASVPINALWVGGVDGGVYVVVRKLEGDGPNIYDAEIYHSVGEIDYKGKLSINSEENTEFDYTQKDSYSGWDGDTLYLRDGRQLKIVAE